MSISPSTGKVSRKRIVISLNEHADSLEKVTTVKRVARLFRDLSTQLRDNNSNYYYYYRLYHYNCVFGIVGLGELVTPYSAELPVMLAKASAIWTRVVHGLG